MKSRLLWYLETIEKRANDVSDVDEPVCYCLNNKNRNIISLDIMIWNEIKYLAKFESNDKMMGDE